MIGDSTSSNGGVSISTWLSPLLLRPRFSGKVLFDIFTKLVMRKQM